MSSKLEDLTTALAAARAPEVEGTEQYDINTVVRHAGLAADYLARMIILSTNPAHALASALEATAADQVRACRELGFQDHDSSRLLALAQRLRTSR